MALKLVQRLYILRQVTLPHLCTATCQNVCVRKRVCISDSTSVCSPSPQISKKSQRQFCITPREPFFLLADSIRPPHDPSTGGRFTSFLHGLSSDKQQAFREQLSTCTSSQQVIQLLRSSRFSSGAAAVAVLHRLADLEQDGSKSPQDLERLLLDPVLNSMCLKLETESSDLEEEVVVGGLLGCTRLFLDPQSRLVARLLSESQLLLDTGCLSVETLCELVQALFSMEGPGNSMLMQALSQIQNEDPAHWNTSELIALYSMLAAGLGKGGRHQDLLNDINTRALSLTPRMDPATVSKTLGALVTLDQTQALSLVIALCKQAVRHVSNFTDTELTVVLSALMHFGHSDHFLIEALERHVPKIAFVAKPETITKVMQYFGRRRIFSPPIFDAVAESFVYRADEYTTEQVAQQIAAMGEVGYVPQEAGRLFRKIESILKGRFSQFHPRSLLELLHACTLLQRYPLNFVSKVFSPYFLQQLQENGGVMDQSVKAQLTQLYMTMKLECSFYQVPRLLPKLRVRSFLYPGCSLESHVDLQLYSVVKNGLVDLLGAQSYFASKVLTPYCYTLDVEIKLDEGGYVLPASDVEEVYNRIALCIDGPKRFAANARHLLGKEAIKQRHLKILGYEVVQIPYYEIESLNTQIDMVEYLHKKIFPHTYRLSW